MNIRAFSGNRILMLGLVLLAALSVSRFMRNTHRSQAVFEGRPVGTWVRLALVEEARSTNSIVVLRIGSPALPYLIEGLEDKSHNPLRQRLEWIRWHLPASLEWEKPATCVARHQNALALLWRMGEQARSAVPAIIRCFETCPEQRYTDGLDCLEALGDIGHAASNAIPFLTKLARGQNSYSLRAAVTEYYITDRTELFVETVLRLARSDPKQVVSAREMFWFRDDAGLNQVFVPMFVQLLFDPRLSDDDRQGVVFELRSRGADSFASIPFLLRALLSTTSAELRSDIIAAIPHILELVHEEKVGRTRKPSLPKGIRIPSHIAPA